MVSFPDEHKKNVGFHAPFGGIFVCLNKNLEIRFVFQNWNFLLLRFFQSVIK